MEQLKRIDLSGDVNKRYPDMVVNVSSQGEEIEWTYKTQKIIIPINHFTYIGIAEFWQINHVNLNLYNKESWNH